MISAFTNTFKIPELRNRVLFTLADAGGRPHRRGDHLSGRQCAPSFRHWFDSQVNNQSGGSVAALFNIFSGGALENCAVFSLGVMPYISASIMMQLLTAVIPQLGKLAKEDGGRQKIMQYTRYATIVLCIFQGYLLALSFENPQQNPFLEGIMDTINKMGVPLVAEPGLAVPHYDRHHAHRRNDVPDVARRPDHRSRNRQRHVADHLRRHRGAPARGAGPGMAHVRSIAVARPSQVSPMVLVLMIAFLVLVIAAVICVTQAQRRISVQYAKRVVGRKVYGGQTQYMPLKVNYAGVMPIIFAQALLVFPRRSSTMAFRGFR